MKKLHSLNSCFTTFCVLNRKLLKKKHIPVFFRFLDLSIPEACQNLTADNMLCNCLFARAEQGYIFGKIVLSMLMFSQRTSGGGRELGLIMNKNVDVRERNQKGGKK